ncbi:MAG: phosphate ABC transporter substrate-binding protein PstS family protein [Acidimicrobiia bacterium]|nr:phosphate ABC transporter substrate-binding protein PstS family protein [Acidimicrobiia bacterium]MDQ3499648.1 phosphate ABC transporter substrate-binding protein PstS family protein [Actinomycetota bacterium]
MQHVKFAASMALILVLVAACGTGGTTTTETTEAGGTETTAATTEATEGTATTSEGTGGLTGQIVISGSSTVEPITARVAEAFGAINPEVAISVDGPGTSDGFVLFCDGETDISDASRAIKDEELATCTANGVEPIEIKVAIDGLSVLTSPNNADITCLDFGDLYALLGPESTGFASWSDANDLAAELAAADLGGSNAPYPEVPLTITAPGEESGTFDSFVELVLGDTAEARAADETTRPDYVASGNDNVIIEGISTNDTSLGWVGYAFYIANQDVVKAIEVDGGDGCVAPTPETIASGDYPIARPLYIYVDKTNLADKPALQAFVDFYLSAEGLANVAEAGYVDLTPEEIQTWTDNWTAQNVGKVDG